MTFSHLTDIAYSVENNTNLICRLMTMAMTLIIHLGLISNSLIVLK